MTVLAVDRAPRVAALAALVAATAVWASTFPVTKPLLGAVAPTAFLTWRLGVAALVLLVLGRRRVRALSGVERRRATLLGVFLGAGPAHTYRTGRGRQAWWPRGGEHEPGPAVGGVAAVATAPQEDTRLIR